MEESSTETTQYKYKRLPQNLDMFTRLSFLVVGTGCFTFGFLKRKPLLLFVGVSGLLSAATAYFPSLKLSSYTQKPQQIEDSVSQEDADEKAIEELKKD